ncbi:hypothetical protein GCM10009557_36130 [Virgisporangium ochraceum]|uniref:Uncharacterized protein n=1 Tax=Virgisporangium ochraceum TaxID=65505 RepID=A0A8J4EDG2_9ACTN|nr:hypothetical protein [Virgisporangium ochraceum]GIJ67917.1 hypothetical protein Voc01_028340 [Virgisporangium ochraceum]
MTTTRPPVITWWEDDPRRLAAELAAMEVAAPGLLWDTAGAGGWQGEVPLWPFDREEPRCLGELVEGKLLHVEINLKPAHPMLFPLVFPKVPLFPDTLGDPDWHLAPIGSLCLFRGTAWWDPTTLVADLIPKISGWYLEYRLMRRGRIERMPDRGIDRDPELDRLVDHCTQPVG